MPIETEWFLEKRVLFLNYSGELTLDEVISSSETIRACIDQTEGQLLHCIGDLGGVTKVPMNLKSLSDAAQAALSHPQFGWMLVYNIDNPVVRFLGDMTTRVFQVRYRVLNTQGEALDFLNSVDATLPPLKPLVKAVNGNTVDRG